jgi:hypothetical protein
MNCVLPKNVLPIFTQINDTTVQIGIQDIKTGEILDCCRYVSTKKLTVQVVNFFAYDFRADLIEHGVI